MRQVVAVVLAPKPGSRTERDTRDSPKAALSND